MAAFSESCLRWYRIAQSTEVVSGPTGFVVFCSTSRVTYRQVSGTYWIVPVTISTHSSLMQVTEQA